MLFIFFLIIFLPTLCGIYFAGNVALQLWKNKESLQYFQKKSHNLFILPNQNIFSGHLFQVIWNPKNYKLIYDLHQKYGKTFAFYLCAQPWVQTTDLDLIKLVMLDLGDKHVDRMRLDVPYKEFKSSIFQVNGDDWRAARRAVAPSMTNYKVRSELVTSDIDNIVDQLHNFLQKQSRKKGSPDDGSFLVDSFHLAKRYALAVIVLVTFRIDNVVDFDNDRDKWVDELADMGSAACNPFCLLAMIFPFLQPINTFLVNFHKVRRQKETINGFISHAINLNDTETKRIQSNKAAGKQDQARLRKRIVDEIIETYKAKKLGTDALKGTLLFLFLAGFETTANTANHLIWQLARHPEIQKKLRNAILKEGGFDAEYLQWCIFEAMRTHTAIPLGYGRVLSSDLYYKGMVIPRGTHVAPSAYTVHLDPEIWPEPEKYMPERWADAAKFHPAAWLGFGLGTRNCVGGKLAMQELKLLFQMLVTNYRIETCESTPKEYNFISPAMLATQPVAPTIVRFVPLGMGTKKQQQHTAA